MKLSVIGLLAVVTASGCTSPDQTSQDQLTIVQRPKATPRRMYWPLDSVVERRDTLLPGPERYRVQVVTTCLNDSAVVNHIVEDAGPALDVSHNYQSELFVFRGDKPWLHQRLTKALFADNPIAKQLGSAQEWALSRTAFVGCQQGKFRFYTRLGVPDSDVFMEAQVALSPTQGLQVISVQQPVE
ncbi:DUF4738 domain-containing protein [Hymenobacter sp. BT186]|uniref:DUF4738 domain-containing protein n=1 Tax=Hymenobacter telluris TaxID=2816474 RepID=A0A939JBR6_9BACT|nr:DUF4738 domain-containing protein [Hymenobacter telluris]MBO0357058.1 DUF4738 domain-containing protein [Hymenobacter telluris]MBW3373085.1 DUF4738 domain-containing protein [Hymenobacter norwichensis]